MFLIVTLLLPVNSIPLEPEAFVPCSVWPAPSIMMLSLCMVIALESL